jgi:hypothetical protein
MDNQLLSGLAYKIVTSLIGLTSIYWGYKLFIKGFDKSAGSVQGEIREIKISIQNAAPGIFFSLVGGFIICFNVIKGIEYSRGTPINLDTSQLANGIYSILEKQRDTTSVKDTSNISIFTQLRKQQKDINALNALLNSFISRQQLYIELLKAENHKKDDDWLELKDSFNRIFPPKINS